MNTRTSTSREWGARDDVLVTGLGVVTTLGCSVEEMTRRFAAGERAVESSGAASVDHVPLDALPADKRVRIGRLDRLCRFFLAASYLAMRDADLQINPADAERAGLSLGTGLGCLLTNEEYNRKVVEQGPAAASPRLFAYTVSSAAAGEVSIAAGIKGPNLTVHMGLAAGLGAVGYGFDLIRMGKADIVLAGGADVIGDALVEALREMGLLKSAVEAKPYESERAGVFPSEAAVVVVLERGERARARGARGWGRIDGYAAGFAPTITRGKLEDPGIHMTIGRALDQARCRAVDIALVLTSAHGTRNDAIELAALRDALGVGAEPMIVAPKAAFGECFGASGTVALALGAGLLRGRPPLADGVVLARTGTSASAAEAARTWHAGDVVMVNALCYSGNCVSLLFSRA